MKKAKILDAHALMVFLEKEEGFEKVKSIFSVALRNNQNILMTSVNFGEVIYIVLRECGEEKTAEIERIVNDLPIDIINVDYILAREAALFKAFKKMSYADCFAVALTKVSKGELITGDPEFREAEKDIKINWI